MSALDYPFWLASRAAGVVAYLLLSLSVAGGLVMAMRLAPVGLRTALRQAHERIALLALAFVAAHGLVLLGDTYLKPSLTDLLVPFQMSYRPLATGLGILAAYGAAALALTFYVRKRLGSKRWRKAHRAIPVFWAMAAVHVLGAGTDAWSLWLLVPTFVTIAAGLWLLAERWLKPTPKPPARRPARRVPA
jgi:sulfoxide reductase heme-binding subunit YedZ